MEKSLKVSEIPENIPQGLKPNLYYHLFAARLKSCPDAPGLLIEFFRNL